MNQRIIKTDKIAIFGTFLQEYHVNQVKLKYFCRDFYFLSDAQGGPMSWWPPSSYATDINVIWNFIKFL